MKLSEAIRLGSMLKPQAFTAPWISGTGAACVLETARLAVGYGTHWAHVCDVWDWLRGLGSCPVSGCIFAGEHKRTELVAVIAHINDTHRWTREQIADWVEQIENQQEQVLAKAEVVAVTRTVC